MNSGDFKEIYHLVIAWLWNSFARNSWYHAQVNVFWSARTTAAENIALLGVIRPRHERWLHHFCTSQDSFITRHTILLLSLARRDEIECLPRAFPFSIEKLPEGDSEKWIERPLRRVSHSARISPRAGDHGHLFPGDKPRAEMPHTMTSIARACFYELRGWKSRIRLARYRRLYV